MVLDPRVGANLQQAYQNARDSAPSGGSDSQGMMDNYIQNMKGPVDLSQFINPDREAQLTKQYLGQMSSSPSSSSSGGSFWGDFGKGMLGTGKSMLDGLENTLGGIGNVFNSSSTLWNDLAKGAGDVSNKVGNGGTPSLQDFLNIGSNMGSDLGKIWSNPGDANAGGDVVGQSAAGAYGPQLGKIVSPLEQYAMPFVDPIANPLIGKAASLAGKGLMEGVGRIPGVEDWANSYLTRNNLGNAPSVYRQAAQDSIARDAQGSQLALPAPGAPTARTMPNLNDAEAQMINQWAGLNNGYEASNPTLQTLENVMRPTNVEFPQIAPQALRTKPQAELDNLINLAKENGAPAGREYEYLQGLYPTMAGRTAPSFDELLNQIKNPSDVVQSLKNQSQTMDQYGVNPLEGLLNKESTPKTTTSPVDGVNFDLHGEPFNASNLPALVEGEGVKGASKEPFQFTGTPPEEEISNVLSQENTNPEFNTLAGMSPGDKLSTALGNVLKTTVGNRVNRALFRAGIGSGVNLLPEDIRNAFLNNRASFQNNNDLLNNHFLDLTKQWANDGVTLDDLQKMRNDFEAGKSVDAKMRPILKTLTDANNEGAAGVESGLNAEKSHKLVEDGMKQLDNYLHLSLDPSGGSLVDKLKNLFAAATDENPIAREGFKGDKANNITSHYTKKREFATAANAEAAGYKVRDPIASTLDRLRESNRDISNTKLYKELFELAKKDPSVMSLDKQRGFTQFQSAVRNNPFHGMYLNPQMSRLLNEVERVPASAKAGFMGSFLRGWDGMTNVYRAANLYNPMIHNHNTFGNALVAFGLDPKNYADAEATLGSKVGKSLGGEASPEIQKSLAWAEKTGALGSDMHPNTLKEISSILKGKGLKGKLGEKYQKFQQEGLWKREKALRLGVFHQAFQDALSKGLKEADAAHVARDVTNEHMIDYSTNNLSPLEKELFSRLDPFYKWHKGNYPLQMKKSFTDPSAMLRQVKANGLFNGLNTALSGHPMAQNLGGDKEKHTNLEIPIGNGQVMSTDRYMPWDETQKMLGESLPSFLYNRLNPLLREGADQLSNKQYYPSSALAPEGKLHLAQSPITLDTDNAGQVAWERGHHIASAVAPNWMKNLEDVLKPNGNSAGFDLAKMGLGALGTFPKQNPVSPTTLQRSKKAEERYLKDQKRQAKTRDKRGN